jgi:hypothetical protein
LDNPRGPFVAVVDLMRSPPDLIVSVGPEASLQAVVGATGFIPVVMIAINFDPLERGYIASLARPGGNITGFCGYYFLRYFSSTSTEQISPDSAGPFTCFDPVGFAIFATTGVQAARLEAASSGFFSNRT